MAKYKDVDPLLVKERFENKFIVSSNGCWEWTGAKDGGGYGIFKSGGKTNNAHRWSYKIYKGEIPTGLNILHSCDNRKCVNPGHLSANTQKVNISDAQERNRFPIRKHPSTYTYQLGCRCDECKTCIRDLTRQRTLDGKRNRKKKAA